MLSKQSADVLLKMMGQTSVCPLADKADENYRALAQARDELFLIVKSVTTVVVDEKEPSDGSGSDPAKS